MKKKKKNEGNGKNERNPKMSKHFISNIAPSKITGKIFSVIILYLNI